MFINRCGRGAQQHGFILLPGVSSNFETVSHQRSTPDECVSNGMAMSQIQKPNCGVYMYAYQVPAASKPSSNREVIIRFAEWMGLRGR